MQQINKRIFIVLLSFVVVGSLITLNPTKANGEQVCIPIHANIETTFVDEGCPGPPGSCTVGEITNGGLLNGETSFIASDSAFGAGMAGEPATTLSYAGELMITTPHGILTMSDVGVFDTAIGKFSELDRVVEGTGMFEGATGVLFIVGDLTSNSSGFIGNITGEICLVK